MDAGYAPWRFAYDEMKEREQVVRVMKMLADVRPARRKRVYVLIGNEPFEECMARVQEVIDAGCEPHVQPYIKLNALTKSPHVRFDWTAQKLRDVARWANRRAWRYTPFSGYRPNARSVERAESTAQGRTASIARRTLAASSPPASIRRPS